METRKLENGYWRFASKSDYTGKPDAWLEVKQDGNDFYSYYVDYNGKRSDIFNKYSGLQGNTDTISYTTYKGSEVFDDFSIPKVTDDRVIKNALDYTIDDFNHHMTDYLFDKTCGGWPPLEGWSIRLHYAYFVIENLSWYYSLTLDEKQFLLDMFFNEDLEEAVMYMDWGDFNYLKAIVLETRSYMGVPIIKDNKCIVLD